MYCNFLNFTNPELSCVFAGHYCFLNIVMWLSSLFLVFSSQVLAEDPLRFFLIFNNDANSNQYNKSRIHLFVKLIIIYKDQHLSNWTWLYSPLQLHVRSDIVYAS